MDSASISKFKGSCGKFKGSVKGKFKGSVKFSSVSWLGGFGLFPIKIRSTFVPNFKLFFLKFFFLKF